MNVPRHHPEAADGGEAARNKLYSQFTRLLDGVNTYVDELDPEVKRVIAPFIAARPTTAEEFFSIPNAMSLTGFLLVVDGARHLTTKAGVQKIAAGRGLDVLDGITARTLGQTSNFGAFIDVTLDKLGMSVIAYEAWKQHAIPRELLVSMGANQLASAALTYSGEVGDPCAVDTSTRASKLGKYSMAIELSAFVGLLWDAATKREQGVETPDLRRSPWYPAVAGAEVLRWCAVGGYASRFLQTRARKRSARSA